MGELQGVHGAGRQQVGQPLGSTQAEGAMGSHTAKVGDLPKVGWGKTALKIVGYVLTFRLGKAIEAYRQYQESKSASLDASRFDPSNLPPVYEKVVVVAGPSSIVVPKLEAAEKLPASQRLVKPTYDQLLARDDLSEFEREEFENAQSVNPFDPNIPDHIYVPEKFYVKEELVPAAPVVDPQVGAVNEIKKEASDRTLTKGYYKEQLDALEPQITMLEAKVAELKGNKKEKATLKGVENQLRAAKASAKALTFMFRNLFAIGEDKVEKEHLAGLLASEIKKLKELDKLKGEAKLEAKAYLYALEDQLKVVNPIV
jgi:hypothetical protein